MTKNVFRVEEITARIHPDLAIMMRENPDRYLGRRNPGLEYFARFAIGSQVRMVQTTREIEVIFGTQPNSFFDWIKAIICDRVPSLAFGWIVPKYCIIKKTIDIPVEERYWNVQPLGEMPEDIRQIYMEQYPDYPYDIGDLDWLNGEPPTRDEIGNKRSKVHDWKTGDRLAWWMR